MAAIMPDPAPPSPQLFLETATAFQHTAAIRAAVELDLFTAIGSGASSAAEIAEKIGAAERGVRILSDYLTILGFLTKQDGAYGLTRDSAVFLDSRSPAYTGGALRFLLSDPLVGAFERLTEAVRKGGTALDGDGAVAPENPMWVDFARGMAPLTAMTADRIAEIACGDSAPSGTVLDIAAGHGLFGIAFAKRCPGLEAVALDWPAVLEVARENAAAAGVADRHRLLPGSAFEVDFGGPHRFALLTNFLHHFDRQTCEALLKKVCDSLAPDGRALTLEFIPNPDRVSPPPSAAFPLVMLASTPGGDAYTFDELDAMARTAGFRRSELHSLDPAMNQLVVHYK